MITRICRFITFGQNRLLLLLLLCTQFVFGQKPEPIGIFSNHQDVGNPKLKGSAVYYEGDQTYHVSAAGTNIWAKTDQFHFLWKKIKGDFIINATVQFEGAGVSPHRKIGIIARDELTTNSRYADGAVHGDVLTSLQYRSKTGDSTYQVEVSTNHPTVIQLERKGNMFTFSAAVFGEPFRSVSKEVALNEEPYVGMFICSHDENTMEKAIFSNVRITIPAADNFIPYRDYIGSNLEVMSIPSGHRKILYTSPNSLQAPNWTRDNKLIYMEKEMLNYYDIPLKKNGTLNTGTVKSNNNDHVISFDGTQIAVSSYAGQHKSTLFVLPITGSDNPKQITKETDHSYLHGWSPDGKKLIFHGQRNDQWDVYQIDIDTKIETNLTNTPGLDDGPEYTPDGKYIYFNSSRTGKMQIWKMNPDGSNQQQVTFDDNNNWFPHFSPDGKWMVYMAFPPDIEADAHPFYKPVYIRLISMTESGAPKTIGYLYGGQGTINVPSWSPDSQRIAFISNTKM